MNRLHKSPLLCPILCMGYMKHIKLNKHSYLITYLHREMKHT